MAPLAVWLARVCAVVFMVPSVALALEGIIDGAGWAIGELQDQVLDSPVTPSETAPCWHPHVLHG